MPSQYVEYKSLLGDPSDNIKGVKGVGKVTAALILKSENISNFITANKALNLTKLLIENVEKIKNNIKLITLNRNLDISDIYIKKMNNDKSNLKVKEIINKIEED